MRCDGACGDVCEARGSMRLCVCGCKLGECGEVCGGVWGRAIKYCTMDLPCLVPVPSHICIPFSEICNAIKRIHFRGMYEVFLPFPMLQHLEKYFRYGNTVLL